MRGLLISALLWTAAVSSPLPADDIRSTRWPDGSPRTEGRYRGDVRHGEYRNWHANGRLAERRQYIDGREAGRQQAWTADGLLYLNYDVRNGRRYGMVNARPCMPGDQTGNGDM